MSRWLVPVWYCGTSLRGPFKCPQNSMCSSDSDDGCQDEEGAGSYDSDEGKDSQAIQNSAEAQKGERAQNRVTPVTRGKVRERGGRIKSQHIESL